jgi:fructose/tagatose bisphosphate aldolase
VPAINIRGLTYHVARAAFRAAINADVAAFIFEIARSEMEYTKQRPDEYSACVLAAAIREGFSGPLFIQGDHYKVNPVRYQIEPTAELRDIEELILESIKAGFYNIDIDASTVVDTKKSDLNVQQSENAQITAAMTHYIRQNQPMGVVINIGGEVGEVGMRNSTTADLKAFMEEYLRFLGSDIKGISKIAVQTGTVHGGVILPDGSMDKLDVDFRALGNLSEVARYKYGMGGAVQHGASTLPDEAFSRFPEVGALEIHLATGFQNIILDSSHFPEALRQSIYAYLLEKYASEKAEGQTNEQFIYRIRKKAFGDFKWEIWQIPPHNLDKIAGELEDRFTTLFAKLNVASTAKLVKKYIIDNQPLD